MDIDAANPRGVPIHDQRQLRLLDVLPEVPHFHLKEWTERHAPSQKHGKQIAFLRQLQVGLGINE